MESFHSGNSGSMAHSPCTSQWNRWSGILRTIVGLSIAFAGTQSHPVIGQTGLSLPDAIRLLNDEDPRFRATGARAVKDLGPAGAAAIPVLIGVLADDRVAEDRVHGEIATVAELSEHALCSIGSPALDPLLTALEKHRNPMVRAAAARVISHLEATREREMAIVDSLIHALSDTDENVRIEVLRALTSRDSQSEKSFSAVITTLQLDNSAWVRVEAVVATGLFDVGSEKAERAFRLALSDESPDVRGAAAKEIGHIGAPSRDTIVELTELLEDRSVRLVATTPDFIEHRAIRIDAAEAIGRIGQSARYARPALAEMLQDADAEARVVAASAIMLVDGRTNDESMRVITSELKADGPDKTTRIRIATDALVELGPLAKPAMPEIKVLLRHDDYLVRFAGVEVLGAIRDHEASELLEEALEDPNVSVRDAARRALENLQEVSEE